MRSRFQMIGLWSSKDGLFGGFSPCSSRIEGLGSRHWMHSRVDVVNSVNNIQMIGRGVWQDQVMNRGTVDYGWPLITEAVLFVRQTPGFGLLSSSQPA